MRQRSSVAFLIAAILVAGITKADVNPTVGQTVWTIVSNLGTEFDNTDFGGSSVTQLSGADAVNGIITIDTAGNYKLSERLTGTTIVIDTDEVCLDLCCFKITVSATNVDGITVNSDKKDIKIFNGIICNSAGAGTGSGIVVQSGASQIKIHNIKAKNHGHGIRLNGACDDEIVECEIVACDLVSNTTGVQLYYADQNIVKNCTAIRNTQAGFELLHSEVNCIIDCQALKNEGTATVAAFRSENGSCNLFEHCVAKRTRTSAQAFCNKAYGFLLTGTEENTKIIDCIVNDTDMTSTVSAVACGIALDGVLLSASDLLVQVSSNSTPTEDVRSIAWSPNGKYIASGDESDSIRVFSFDGSDLIHIIQSSFLGGNVRSVAWSPDGKHIASGDETNKVRVFSFDGSSLSQVAISLDLVGDVLSVAWSPDGKYIATGDGGTSNKVRVFSFDGSSLSQVAISLDQVNDVLSVTWSPDGKFIATGDFNDFVRVFSFDGSNLTPIATDSTPVSAVFSVAWSPNGKYIVTGEIGFVRVFSFDGSSLTIEASHALSGEVVNSVAWSPDGKYIISGDGDSFLRVFSFDGSSLEPVFNTSAGNAVFSVSWSPDGKYIVFGNGTGKVEILDAMNAPQNCLIKGNCVCDTEAFGQFVGTGIMGGGRNYFFANTCCNNEVNFTFGIPNVFYGCHNIQRPMDNLSMPLGQ